VNVTVNDRLTLNIVLQVGDCREDGRQRRGAAAGDHQQFHGDADRPSPADRASHHLRESDDAPVPGIGTTWNAPLHYQAPWDTSGPGMSSVNGSKMRAIDFQVDGVSNNNKSNDVAYNPSVSSWRSSKWRRSPTTPRKATAPHGSTPASSRAPTNCTDRYTYLQNKALNANGYFANLPATERRFRLFALADVGGRPGGEEPDLLVAGIERIVP